MGKRWMGRALFAAALTWGVGAAGAAGAVSSASTGIDQAAACRIARAAVGGGTGLAVTPDLVGTIPVWDVHVLRGERIWDVKVDEATGAVMGKTRLTASAPVAWNPNLGERIAFADHSAVAAVGGGQVRDVRVGTLGQIPVWQIEVVHRGAPVTVWVSRTDDEVLAIFRP